jgi:hypothetical protein
MVGIALKEWKWIGIGWKLEILEKTLENLLGFIT